MATMTGCIYTERSNPFLLLHDTLSSRIKRSI